VYLPAATAVVVAASWALVATHWKVSSPMIVVGLAVVAYIAERVNVALAQRVVVSVALLPALFAAVLLGPPAAMIVYATSAAALPFPAVGRITYAMNRAIVGLGMGLAASFTGHLVQSRAGSAVAAATAGALVGGLGDVCLTTLTFRIRRNRDWKQLFRQLLPMVVAASPFYASVVALLALGYKSVSPWTLPLFFAPALAAQRFFVLYQDQRRLTAELVDVNSALERANLSFASALVATLDARDRYTAGHSAAVATYARDIGARMGLGIDQQQLAHVCGLVHDIGKIGLPAGLLEKPGALTVDERREMERHCEIGERILANVATYAEIAAVVRHHHERFDGAGYPDGLIGAEIPMLSRILAVADAYNAMTSDRPYRDAMPSRVARLRLAQGVESQFDPAVVAAFEAILAESTRGYRTGEFGHMVGVDWRSPTELGTKEPGLVSVPA
jgi:HD-GYP domain-containing protein (c-di-GMP phosphodiesterase class II)